MNIKPIETVYNGYRFRSRLEARWAVFFDFIGLKYLYEMEGYTNGTINYLPDFFIPSLDVFIEIKPFTEDWPSKEIASKGSLAPKLVYYFCGEPYGKDGDMNYRGFYTDGGMSGDCDQYLCVCPDCGSIGIQYSGWADRNKHKDFCTLSTLKHEKVDGRFHALLEYAYVSARSARFEFGESG